MERGPPWLIATGNKSQTSARRWPPLSISHRCTPLHALFASRPMRSNGCVPLVMHSLRRCWKCISRSRTTRTSTCGGWCATGRRLAVADFLYTIHGPMWQFECEDCQHMSDCYESEAQALAQAENHDCFKSWANRIPPSVLEHLVNQREEADRG